MIQKIMTMAADADIKWIDYERPWLYQKQEDIFFGPHRYGYCESSTKAGKTHGCIVWLVELTLLLGLPGRKFWWVAPVRAQAKIAYDRIKHAVPADMIRSNESELYHEFPNGARIEFKSAEKPDNLYGEDVYAAVFDEASRGRYDAWKALRSTLTATRGPVRLIANVKGKANWFYIECRAVERGRENAKYERITAWDAVDAGILDVEEVEDAKRVLPAKDFSELYEARAQDDEDAFLPSEYVEAAQMRKDVEAFGPLIIGADPSQGQGDPAAFAFRRGSVIESVEEHKGMDEFGFIAHCLRLIEVRKPIKLFVDATGFGATIVKSIHRDYPRLVTIVQGFHMQNRSTFPDEYANKRAECWGEMRKWFISKDDPPQLPADQEGLAVELTCIRKKANSSGRLLLEAKEDLAARGYSSPNMADACSLTFAEPIEFVMQGEIKYPDARRRRNLT